VEFGQEEAVREIMKTFLFLPDLFRCQDPLLQSSSFDRIRYFGWVS
jgi:hypothetical protein